MITEEEILALDNDHKVKKYYLALINGQNPSRNGIPAQTIEAIKKLVNNKKDTAVIETTVTNPTTTPVQSTYTSVIAKQDHKKNEETLYIYSLVSGDLFDLNGVIEDVSHQWTSNWTEESVYGRIDPIATYSNTTRALNFSITMNSKFNLGEDEFNSIRFKKANYLKMNAIANMCYPGYELTKGENINATIKAPPLVGIKHGNIIQGVLNGPKGSGLTGFQKAYIKSLSITFEKKGLYDLGVNNEKYFARIKVDFSFGLLHDHMVGFDKNGRPLVNEMENKDGKIKIKDGEIKYPFGVE